MTVSATEGSLVNDLAVDTSAVMAVLLREPSAEALLERLCEAVQPAVAAPTRTEILQVALVKLGEIGQERAREFLDQQALLTVAWDGELADQAALAFSRYGKGLSGLNCGLPSRFQKNQTAGCRSIDWRRQAKQKRRAALN